MKWLYITLEIGPQMGQSIKIETLTADIAGIQTINFIPLKEVLN